MFYTTTTATFKSSPDKVWNLLSNYEYYPKWRKDVDSIVLHEGHSFTEVYENYDDIDKEITLLIEGVQMEFESKCRNWESHVIFQFVKVKEGCKVEFYEYLEEKRKLRIFLKKARILDSNVFFTSIIEDLKKELGEE